MLGCELDFSILIILEFGTPDSLLKSAWLFMPARLIARSIRLAIVVMRSNYTHAPDCAQDGVQTWLNMSDFGYL